MSETCRLLDTVTVIIRSVGERTEALCRQLILEQGVPEGNVVIVSDAPPQVRHTGAALLG